jgi:hypothetical protein
MNNRYLKVDGNLNLVRDPKTNAIINIDKNLSNSYVINKNKKLEQEKTIQDIKNNLFLLKNDIDEIKSLLHKILK